MIEKGTYAMYHPTIPRELAPSLIIGYQFLYKKKEAKNINDIAIGIPITYLFIIYIHKHITQGTRDQNTCLSFLG